MAAAPSATSLSIQNADAAPAAGQASAAPAGGSGTMRAAIVSLGGELFTIDLQNVREVFVVESITPVPGMPAGLVGVTNLRGSVVPLLDLRQMIGLAAENALKYAVVIKHGNWQVGVLVDTVPEIRTLSKDQFLPAPVGSGDGGNPFVSTVVNLEDRLRGVLETSVVLSHFEGTG
ncbi:MAG TPA: chemotaxis protein CheW [Nitrospira sp.]|jgi:purine-binding chemotaxis protein CheW|nr:chemotaxis protein CheW [Nitrospira sp.]